MLSWFPPLLGPALFISSPVNKLMKVWFFHINDSGDKIFMFMKQGIYFKLVSVPSGCWVAQEVESQGWIFTILLIRLKHGAIYLPLKTFVCWNWAPVVFQQYFASRMVVREHLWVLFDSMEGVLLELLLDFIHANQLSVLIKELWRQSSANKFSEKLILKKYCISKIFENSIWIS